MELGSTHLSVYEKEKLDEVVLRTKQAPSSRARVVGYTAVGEPVDELAWHHGVRRAEAAKNHLVLRGIDPGRITIEDRGTQNSTGNAAQDPRAEVILTAQ
ncbi:MAG: OmpA family protein [Chthoniobacterales bacterium]